MGFFTAYFDAAGHPADQPFVVVSGYVSNYMQWKLFNTMWEKAHSLAGTDLPFHMSDFNASRGSNKNKIRKDYRNLSDAQAYDFLLKLTSIQQMHMLFAVSAVVKISDYMEVNTVLDLRRVVPPYALGARLCIARLNEWQTKYIGGAPIETIFEDGDFERGKFIDLMRVEGLPAPIFKDKKDFPGLQAADHIAWELNTQVKTELSAGKNLPPQRDPYQRLLAIPHTAVTATQADLIKLCETKDIMPRIVKP
jgi:hypothetical protein